MGHLGHHAANRRRVFALDNLVQPREAQALDDELVLTGVQILERKY